MTPDPFFASVKKLFYDNTKKVSYSHDEKKHYLSLKIYRPLVEEREHRLQLSGFRVVIECSSVNAVLWIYELALGRTAQFESVDEPIEMVYMLGSKEYKLVQKLISDMDKAKEQEKETYIESVKNEFVEGRLTFENPMETYIEEMNKKKVKEASSYSVEPEMLLWNSEDEEESDVGG